MTKLEDRVDNIEILLAIAGLIIGIVFILWNIFYGVPMFISWMLTLSDFLKGMLVMMLVMLGMLIIGWLTWFKELI